MASNPFFENLESRRLLSASAIVLHPQGTAPTSVAHTKMIFTVTAEKGEAGETPGSEYELILKGSNRFKIKALHVSGQGGPDKGSYAYSAKKNAATLTYEIKIPKALRKQLTPTLHTVSLVFSTSTQGTFVDSAGKHTSDSGTFTD